MPDRDAVHARLVTLGTVVLPRTRARLGAMVEDGSAALPVIVDEMTRDPLLTAAVLGQANLAVATPGLDPAQALLSLGFASLERLLAAAIEVPEPQRRPLAQCYALANATTVLIRTIADYRATRLLRRPDDAVLQTLGMLHDLGTAVALLHFTPAYARASIAARAGRGDFAPLLDAELGLAGSGLGRELAAAWNLPEPLATVMGWHLRPMEAPAELELTALVHIARSLARGLGFHAPGDRYAVPIDERAVHLLGLGMIDLERILNRVLDDLDEMEIFASEMLRDQTLPLPPASTEAFTAAPTS